MTNRTVPDHRSEEQLRQVFGQNLRELIKNQPSISALCRALKMNRTQFNRYLNGEAFPRPDVLNRICVHFKTDARILLEPLQDMRRSGLDSLTSSVDLSAFGRLRATFDHNRLPDGLYRFITADPADRPGQVYIDVFRMFTLSDNSKAMSFGVPRSFAEMTHGRTDWQHRKSFGAVTQHPDGISTLQASSYSSLLVMGFFSYAYRGVDNLLSGYSCVTQSRTRAQVQVQPALLERIRPACADQIAARRACGIHSAEVLPAYQYDYLSTWSAP